MPFSLYIDNMSQQTILSLELYGLWNIYLMPSFRGLGPYRKIDGCFSSVRLGLEW